ncbi:hypothetical protein THASP1DRAFT_22341 [Thamnocephalis sphaerospora]|uniref:Uncharacterized protein n=1 Tax=Thamnocephalis sphaerospora TaxID=78915 RepID=A0A4P9XUF3_9FUNG|nr:hypothetical protein THASP1DRAFT_22341 [Thamnocephalis sphaerospora]|eukprot:RKP09857.1 hypothetical protein THASP1DRAFT_22341 [Thamnocephalis sphaerospora]
MADGMSSVSAANVPSDCRMHRHKHLGRAMMAIMPMCYACARGQRGCAGLCLDPLLTSSDKLQRPNQLDRDAVTITAATLHPPQRHRMVRAKGVAPDRHHLYHASPTLTMAAEAARRFGGKISTVSGSVAAFISETMLRHKKSADWPTLARSSRSLRNTVGGGGHVAADDDGSAGATAAQLPAIMVRRGARVPGHSAAVPLSACVAACHRRRATVKAAVVAPAPRRVAIRYSRSDPAAVSKPVARPAVYVARQTDDTPYTWFYISFFLSTPVRRYHALGFCPIPCSKLKWWNTAGLTVTDGDDGRLSSLDMPIPLAQPCQSGDGGSGGCGDDDGDGGRAVAHASTRQRLGLAEY